MTPKGRAGATTAATLRLTLRTLTLRTPTLRTLTRCTLTLCTLALCPLTTASIARGATLPVTTLADVDAADGECSLREAIVAANTDAAYRECPSGSGADRIELLAPGTVDLVADLPRIEQALTVRGLGVAGSAIDGNGTLEILHFIGGAPANGEVLRIEGLQLTGGRASEGGAIFVGRGRVLEVAECLLIGNESTFAGGAIYGDQALSIDVVRSSLVGNTAGAAGGGIGIQSGGVTSIVDSTLAANVAAAGPGGAVHAHSSAELVVRQSTVSGNLSTGEGGGLAVVVTPLHLESSTLVGNVADSDGNDDGDGGGLMISGPISGTLASSILAVNQDATPAGGTSCPDGYQKLGATTASDGFNLVGANDCIEPGFPPGLPNVHGDLVGTSAAPVDPLLSPLEDNGGPTWSHLPTTASPATDQGSCPGAAADQRVFGNPVTVMRVVDDPAVPDAADGCDIGSVEAGAVSIAGLVFQDDFETGDTSRWSTVSF